MAGPARKTLFVLLRLVGVPLWVCAGLPPMMVLPAPADVTAAASPEDVGPTGLPAALMPVLVLLTVLALAADGPRQWIEQRVFEKLHANSHLVKPVDFDNFTSLMEDLGCYWLGWNHYPWSEGTA